MKFLKTIDLHRYGQAVLEGQIKLQSGQWVQCGEGSKSRFESTSGRSITAFHGPNGIATRKYLSYVRARKEEGARLKAIREAKYNISPEQLSLF